MKTLDLKKDLKYLYQPSAKKIEIIQVPNLQFAMIDGAIEKGHAPGNSPGYAEAIQALYGISYTLKFMFKKRKTNAIDYPVMALEGLLWITEGIFDITIKDNWAYTLMIMQPDIITADIFEEARDLVCKKKGNSDALNKVRLTHFEEGLCVQTMHIGPYATEPATIDRMKTYIQENGLQDNVGPNGKHHEIYLSDPRRVIPEKMKTVLRTPSHKNQVVTYCQKESMEVEMKILDLLKQYKNLYNPPANKPVLVEVPRLQFAMFDGAIEKGYGPGNSPAFAEATQTLYSISYTLKFMLKKRKTNAVDYPVMALEGLWWVEDGIFDITVKDNWFYTLMILQPDIITRDVFAEGLAEVKRKKGDSPALSQLRLANFEEGLCMQVMHIGPYATEPATVERMRAFALENGYHDNVGPNGKHHEIYLGDPRKADPAKLKTVLRHPLERK